MSTQNSKKNKIRMFMGRNKKKFELPPEFTNDVVKIIRRIEKNIHTIGVLYLKNNLSVMYTVPVAVETVLSHKLPQYTQAVKSALFEIDVFDELIGYRIITKRNEISVVVGPNFTAVAVHNIKKSENFEIMKIITNLLKDSLDEQLVRATAAINKSNPIVDRIMDDDSVEGVVMTNKEGAPILTNMSLTHATLYGRALNKYGVMTMIYMKELNPLDDILVIRMQTKKNELILAPHNEFLIIMKQHFRKASKVTNVSKR